MRSGNLKRNLTQPDRQMSKPFGHGQSSALLISSKDGKISLSRMYLFISVFFSRNVCVYMCVYMCVYLCVFCIHLSRNYLITLPSYINLSVSPLIYFMYFLVLCLKLTHRKATIVSIYAQFIHACEHVHTHTHTHGKREREKERERKREKERERKSLSHTISTF